MINFQGTKLAICGSLHPATKDGFIRMLHEANEAAAAGYDFLGCERIEKQLGVVYRKRAPIQSQPVRSGSPLVDEFTG